MCCLRRYGALTASAGRITTTASTPMAPFLVPPKLSTSAHEAISATEQPRCAAALASRAPSRKTRSWLAAQNSLIARSSARE